MRQRDLARLSSTIKTVSMARPCCRSSCRSIRTRSSSTTRNSDFALVAVAARDADLAAYGLNRLIEAQGKAILGDFVTIVQHPGGEKSRSPSVTTASSTSWSSSSTTRPTPSRDRRDPRCSTTSGRSSRFTMRAFRPRSTGKERSSTRASAPAGSFTSSQSSSSRGTANPADQLASRGTISSRQRAGAAAPAPASSRTGICRRSESRRDAGRSTGASARAVDRAQGNRTLRRRSSPRRQSTRGRGGSGAVRRAVPR